MTGSRDPRPTSAGATGPEPGEGEVDPVNHVNPPPYPAAEDPGVDDEPEATTLSWAARIGLAALVVGIVVIVVLHLSGTVGPAAH